MRYKYYRRYIQFNDLIFDEVDAITADDYSVSFKRNDTEYTFKHGSYSPHKQRTVLARAYSFSMTIKLRMKKLPCEYRKFYRNFAVSELSKIGRLWAVQGEELMWAWAELDKFGESGEADDNLLELDVDVFLPEGIWHKADLQRTFMVPWDACDFMDCLGFKDLQPCVSEEVGCCECTETIDADCCCECLERDMALCYHKEELQDFYKCCGPGYRLVYDCEAAERLFNTLTHHMGQKLCTDHGVIAGQIYSNSDLPTEYVKISINGKVKDPTITINGNENQIIGEYDSLTIYPDGTVEYNDCSIADVSAWVIPEGNTYGWTLNPGNNRVIIDLGICCGITCAYFELDAITM